MKERQWEYKLLIEHQLDSKLLNRLNVLGGVGWELINAVYDHNEERHILYFKRELT